MSKRDSGLGIYKAFIHSAKELNLEGEETKELRKQLEIEGETQVKSKLKTAHQYTDYEKAFAEEWLKEKKNERKEVRRKRKKHKKWISRGLSIFSVIATLATVGIAGFSAFQTTIAWQEESKSKRPYFSIYIDNSGNIEINLTNTGMRPAHDISMLAIFLDTKLEGKPEIHTLDDFANDAPIQSETYRFLKRHYGKISYYLILAIRYKDPITQEQLHQQWLFLETPNDIESNIPKEDKNRVFANHQIKHHVEKFLKLLARD
jgi:hypothetical protein